MPTKKLIRIAKKLGFRPRPRAPEHWQHVEKVFLIGAMKCGTNTLYYNLAKHPRIATPDKKELDYFLSRSNPGGYLAEFLLASNTEATLDGTTQYSKHPTVPLSSAKIAQAFPEAKIIYNIRDPLERLESQIAHHIARDVTVTLDNWRVNSAFQRSIEFGQYYQQISLYSSQFPKNQVFIGLFEEMVADQREYFSNVCRFIGVDPSLCEVDDVTRNPRRDSHGAALLKFSAEQDAEFAQLFRNDIETLQEVYGVDTSAWRRFNNALSS